MAGILTAVGEAKAAASIGGAAINFAAIRIGDGNGGPVTPNRLMTNLVHRVGGVYPVTASARDPDNPACWRVTTEIPAGEGPFTMREIAVFDTAGDMLAIAAHPVVEFTGVGGDQVSVITDIVFPVSGAATVTVTISASAAVPLARNLRPFFMAVESATTVAPPANPTVGATYIIPADAVGAWAGQAGSLAQWTGESWSVVLASIGHLVCVTDQALDASTRYLRKEAAGWVSAQASMVAYGLVRRATATEIAAGSGNGYVTPEQMVSVIDNLNDWDNIGGKPAAFPPDAHSHDNLYVRLSPPGGTAQTVAGPLTVAGKATAGALEVSGGAVFRENVNVCYPYPQLSIQRTADNQSNMITGRRADGKAIYGIELGNWSSDNFTVIRFDQAGNFAGTPLHFNGAGAWGIDGDFGAPGMVLASRGNGAPPNWRSAEHAIPALHYEQRYPSGGARTPQLAVESVWTNMDLNTLLRNAIAGASAGGGAINLPAGTYRAQFYGAIAVSDSMFRVRLRDVTNGFTVAVGSYAFRWDGLETIIPSLGWGEFTLPAAASIYLQLWFQRTQNPVAGGDLRGFSDGESIPAFSVFLTKVG